jgi:hypothetical protein
MKNIYINTNKVLIPAGGRPKSESDRSVGSVTSGLESGIIK